ncbi:putative prolyl-tRNA synthetase associated domain-containing protein 1 [Tubulanus polymorphus]|uniref:putative prolyl-tRNA synthetase associated domain-containing protein 1 n=1 Tax=Tubulanus polymorphus TaxID=672921 RepID=UPI003DA30772
MTAVHRAGLEEKLNEWGIHTTTTEHPQVFTVEAMMEHVGHLKGAVTKNLFLSDKKKKLYLFSALHNRDIKLNELAKKIGAASGGIRFADESVLFEKLGVKQGCVTAFALINDVAGDVKFCIDADLINGTYDTIYFHPLDNAASSGISPEDFKKFLTAVKHEPLSVSFD